MARRPDKGLNEGPNASPASKAGRFGTGQREDLRAPSEQLSSGTVMQIGGGFYDVAIESGTLRCVLRGKLRKQLIYPTSRNVRQTVQKVRSVKATSPVSVGDRVRVRPVDQETGVIEEILPRDSSLTRQAAGTNPVAQTMLAGIDQLAIVFAVRDPEPHLRMIDRFLVVAEAAELPAIICLNKADLGYGDDLAYDIGVYRQIGYPVILTSTVDGTGLADLTNILAGKTSAFVGPSGVGKSSLLDALLPDLDVDVGEISELTGKGRHTTSQVTLVPLVGSDGGFIADTPGLRELAFWDVDSSDLEHCFPEFRAFLGRCRFSGCTHLHEPNCAVLAAVEAGQVDQRRYESYARLRV
jgi:ribosome biogenesis GTPase / thiamine phosphate phosphatase